MELSQEEKRARTLESLREATVTYDMRPAEELPLMVCPLMDAGSLRTEDMAWMYTSLYTAPLYHSTAAAVLGMFGTQKMVRWFHTIWTAQLWAVLDERSPLGRMQSLVHGLAHSQWAPTFHSMPERTHFYPFGTRTRFANLLYIDVKEVRTVVAGFMHVLFLRCGTSELMHAYKHVWFGGHEDLYGDRVGPRVWDYLRGPFLMWTVARIAAAGEGVQEQVRLLAAWRAFLLAHTPPSPAWVVLEHIEQRMRDGGRPDVSALLEEMLAEARARVQTMMEADLAPVGITASAAAE